MTASIDPTIAGPVAVLDAQPRQWATTPAPPPGGPAIALDEIAAPLMPAPPRRHVAKLARSTPVVTYLRKPA
jgi:hypothetical protein